MATSSNSGLRTAAALSIALLCLTACASDPKSPARTAVTPTELFPLRAAPADDQIALALHTEGLSPAQTAALRALADRRRDSAGGAIVLKTPEGADPAIAAGALTAARAVLTAAGVPDSEITTGAYAPKDDPKAPLLVSYTFEKAQIPKCGRSWDDLTHTEDNRVQSNFGCAESANMMAQIANPADIAGPRPEQPASASRRQTVFGKYAEGKVTAADEDASKSGAVSRAVP